MNMHDVSPWTLDLAGQVALVTGGSRGIGLGVARALLQAGAGVAVCSRTTADLERARRELDGGSRVSAHRCDVSDAAAVDGLLEEVHRAHGRLDVLVCSHGVYPGVRRLVDIEPAEFDRTVSINLGGTFRVTRAAVARMAPGGRIVLISSVNALVSQFGAPDYDASKAAVHGLMRAMAIELAPVGITVNAIAPGWTRTEMSAAELDHLSGRVLAPTRRVGEPADVARAVLWLADPENRNVTGTSVVVDGGVTAMLPVPWQEGEEMFDS